MGRSRNKRRHLQSPEQLKREVANQKRLRIIYGFIIVMAAFVLPGGVFINLRKYYATDLYHAFIFDWIGTALLYLGGLTLLLCFIYGCLVIILKNPQKISKNQVIKWGGIGIFCLSIGVIIFQELSSLTINSVRDMKDYSNGMITIEDLKVVGVKSDGRSRIETIKTEEQELSLLLNVFRIEEGKTYRFTYTERTGIILNVEKE